MDRLADMQNGHARITVRDKDTFSDAGIQDDDSNPLAAFYELVTQCQGIIRDIQTLTHEVTHQHSERMLMIDDEKRATASKGIANLTERINTTIRLGKQKLDIISKSTVELKKTPEMEQNNAGVIKIQQNQHAHLLKMYMAAVQEYQTAQKENEKAYVEQTKRQIMTKMREADGSTISAERAQELAMEAIEQGTENVLFQQAKDTLARIIENRNDIYRIEQSMRELNQLFQDLAVLVNEQEEAMGSILVNIGTTRSYMARGTNDQHDAKEDAKKSRKKFCWLMVLAFVAFLFVLAVVVGIVTR